MNASKEEARKANESLETAAMHLDKCMPESQRWNKDFIKQCLLRVQNFIEAAERKLPTEAAYSREKSRK
jgi:hypothetical protein